MKTIWNHTDEMLTVPVVNVIRTDLLSLGKKIKSIGRKRFKVLERKEISRHGSQRRRRSDDLNARVVSDQPRSTGEAQ